MMEPTVTYRVGWLVDGSGKPALSNRIIVVAGGRIRHITEASSHPEPGTNNIDLSHCTVIPALVDSHAHLVMSGTTDSKKRKEQLESTYQKNKNTILRHLRQHFASGVFAIRDGGDHNGDTLRFKYDRTVNTEPHVTFASPGRARFASGRYGKLIGIPVESGKSLAESAFQEKKSRRDHLKIVNSGLNSLTQFGVESAPQFDENQLAAVIAAAKRHGQPTMVHANGHLPVKLAVEAGCQSIEHGFFMGRENMRRMADNGVVWVPTAVTMKAYMDLLKRQQHQRDASFADVTEKNLQHQLSQMGKARELGVTMAVGTDSGSPGVQHGESIQSEIQLFVAAGFSVEGAIRCASRNGALLMGLTDRGRIAPGMRADFLAVTAPVEKVPEAIDNIVYHVVEGKRIHITNA